MCKSVAPQVEFGLPDLESRTQIFQIHTRTMNVERNIRFELLARLCPNSTGADIRSVCTEAGMYAIRQRRKARPARPARPRIWGRGGGEKGDGGVGAEAAAAGCLARRR